MLRIYVVYTIKIIYINILIEIQKKSKFKFMTASELLLFMYYNNKANRNEISPVNNYYIHTLYYIISIMTIS